MGTDHSTGVFSDFELKLMGYINGFLILKKRENQRPRREKNKSENRRGPSKSVPEQARSHATIESRKGEGRKGKRSHPDSQQSHTKSAAREGRDIPRKGFEEIRGKEDQEESMKKKTRGIKVNGEPLSRGRSRLDLKMRISLSNFP